MIIEKFLNKWILFFLLFIPICGLIFEEPYYITLTTKVVILGIAGIGLNLALGYCGLISFGHAAFLALVVMLPEYYRSMLLMTNYYLVGL